LAPGAIPNLLVELKQRVFKIIDRRAYLIPDIVKSFMKKTLLRIRKNKVNPPP
jgi:hypothetical protein